MVSFPISRRFYRLLLRLYPEAFRRAYGAEMESVYLASVRIQVERWGLLGVPWSWARALSDTVVHGLLMRVRERRGPRFGDSGGGGVREALSRVVDDLRLAARRLGRNPTFTVAGVITLAVGIGLNSAAFGVVHSMLLRPLPGVERPEELVQIYRTRGATGFLMSSIPHFIDLRAGNEVFQGVAAWNSVPVFLSADGRSERITAQVVSSDFFDVLGVPLARGPGFTADDREDGSGRAVVILDHRFWQTRLGADPGVVGSPLTINGKRWEVVGVAPEGFHGPFPFIAPALWAPLGMHPELTGSRDQSEIRGNNFLNVIARLKPGVGIGKAEEWADLFAARLRQEYPEDYEGVGIRVFPQSKAGIHPSIRAAQLGLSGVTMGVVALLLLIACVNVANLFLASAQVRGREMAVRCSLGAGRARLVRQLLTEYLLFALLAGGAGLLLAYSAVSVANRVRISVEVPVQWNIALDAPVLVFTLVVTLLSSLVFGLAPALRSLEPDLNASLHRDGPPGTSRPLRASQVLVGAQVAISTLLLVCAGLFVHNLREAMAIEKGFTADDLLLATLDLRPLGYEREESEELFSSLMSRLRAHPEVRSVGLASSVPLGLDLSHRLVSIPGYQPSQSESMSVFNTFVDPEYFATMGIPILEGRAFRDSDGDAGGSALVVNRRFAERFWPGESAIGKRVETADAVWEVVGVVPTGKYQRLGEEPTAFMYFPWPRLVSSTMTLHVRTAESPSSVLPLLRREVEALDPNLPVFNVTTMNDHLGLSLLPARLGGVVLGVFGGLCLVLVSVGIYGVVAHSVSRRTREVGIRIAMGALPRGVTAKVIGEELRIVLIGLAAGIAGALAASGPIGSLLYTRSGMEPAVFLAAPAFLAVVAVVASYLPARTAARVDPVQALRSE